MHNFTIQSVDNTDVQYIDEINRKFKLMSVESTNDSAADLSLRFESGKLTLHDQTQPKVMGVCVDFCSDAMTYRRHNGGGFKEFIAKAIGVKSNHKPSVVDATAGLGRDSFLLASLGCKVIMIERSPVVAAMLHDGLRRCLLSEEISAWLPDRLSLQHGIASEVLTQWRQPKPDVVYLDPMFPHRKKSAAVKKEMQLFQRLLGTDLDADDLLTPALLLATTRVVVKRPASAPFLMNVKPHSQVVSKKHRYDVYSTKV